MFVAGELLRDPLPKIASRRLSGCCRAWSRRAAICPEVADTNESKELIGSAVNPTVPLRAALA